MERNVKLFLGISVCMLAIPGLKAQDSIKQEAVTTNKSVIIQESQKLVDNKPVRKQNSMAQRRKARAASAHQRRERLMAVREKRKKDFEKRQAAKAAQTAKIGSEVKKSPLTASKPAAPKNSMLKTQPQGPIVLRNSATQVKKT